ncbi:MAG: hypothetical protein U9N56_11845 [Actinomycetota bacterium]|nr:hypothetical protein [Actinomycetota bacterium]
MKSLTRYGVAFALLVSACGGGADSSTTTAPVAATTTDPGGAATTSEAPQPTTTTTMAPETTTTASGSTADPNEVVSAKTAAVEAATPEGWTAATGPQEEFDQDTDLIYESCLTRDEFDIDNLDSVSVATLLTTVDGPAANPPFPGATASIEARVIESEAVAEQVFAVFERLYGSEEGVQCLTDVVFAAMGEDLPADDIEFKIEQVTIEGSQAGARFEVLFDIEGFESGIYFEFQGARIGDCTVVGTFVSFGEPFDRDVAGALFSAAVNA